MYLSTKKSFLTLLVATAFLTGCQEDTANDTQTSSLALAPKVKTTLPPGLAKKVVEETQPIVEETQPIVEETQPIVEETQPIVEETQPIVEETQPIVEETQPVVEETQPIAEETQPIVEETQPIVEETQPIVEETQPIVAMCVEGDAAIEGHITDKETGAGLPDVQVNVGGCTTTTDAQGFYKLANIAADDRAVVTFDSEGYYRNSAVIQIDQYLEGTTILSPNYFEVELDKYISHWAYDSQTHVVSGAHIEIPIGIYINNDGSQYTGQVTAGLSYRISTEKGSDIAFPGEYKGKDSNGVIVPFVSYGFTVIDLTDENGVALGVSEDITLTFEATEATENIIPLWNYDYDQGLWIEEGYAQLQDDGSYQGAISHPGTWSLNKPIENSTGIYRARILNQDGTPARDVRVHALGDNWIATNLSTDADGIFEIEVTPDSSFLLVAYNYKDKYEAVYNSTIPAIASGEIVENRM